MNPTDHIFWPYLLPILQEQKTRNGIVYIQMSDANGMDRLMGDSRSEDVYPGIYVLRPKYAGQLIDNHLMLAKFDLTLFVFVQGRPDDYESEDLAYQHAETVVSEIVKHLQHDRFEYRNYLEFDSIRIEPVIYSTGVDAAYGYELKLKLGLAGNEAFC
ncbi:hypothetical protein DYBT9275_00919 [Dyadobacter sp. CECT 9275]|uniref:Uncharacterized protein n=1 Tax=Dyadobacter helix TaxID=2822344 RepID=A0A916JCL7_9BACT|nr:hypothetical protein [Dyadobacter sp. CECT 9275]CAG4992230.1 hypothetical protein DYBT9275_00919 [Dyadobacter sp. CECT 9275]